MRTKIWCSALVTFALSFAACESTESMVLVDVKTDYVPGEDFDSVRVEIAQDDVADIEHIAVPGGDYVRGRRVGSEAVDEGDLELTVRLLQNGAPIASRRVSVTVRGPTAATVVITRDCSGVVCTELGDNGLLQSCYSGRCSDSRCTVETPEFCPPICSSDMECSSDGCRQGRCETNACFSVPEDAECPSGERCNTSGMCVPREDAGPGPDGGSPDTARACPCGRDEVCVDERCEVDVDGDGFAAPADCDDERRETYPGAPEACDGADNDCDEVFDEDAGVAEACNGVDDDCDSTVDESTGCEGCDIWTFAGHMYMLCPDTMMPWLVAINHCGARGMAMVSVDSQAENDSIAARVTGPSWLGLNDRDAEGTFIWDTGAEFSYDNWAPTQPDNMGAGAGEDCVSMQAGGMWRDEWCNELRMPLCESP